MSYLSFWQAGLHYGRRSWSGRMCRESNPLPRGIRGCERQPRIELGTSCVGNRTRCHAGSAGAHASRGSNSGPPACEAGVIMGFPACGAGNRTRCRGIRGCGDRATRGMFVGWAAGVVMGFNSRGLFAYRSVAVDNTKRRDKPRTTRRLPMRPGTPPGATRSEREETGKAKHTFIQL